MQYRYFHEGQLKVDPTTGTKCRTGQLNHQFVEQKFANGVWVGIGDNDGVRYGDVAGAGCRFREGMRDGDYFVDVETEVGGFLLAEGDGWVNCGSASGYLGYPQLLGTKILFWGKVSEIAGGQMPNKVLGSNDFLIVAGSPETYQCPNTQDYIDADTDYIWFRQYDASQRTVTTAELISYDLQRTPVKYLDDAPNTIEEIVILKAGEVLTAGERDNLFRYMHLPIEWHNDTNAYGHVKDNRIGQNLWIGFGTEVMPDVSVWAASGLAWWSSKDACWSGDNTKIIINGNGGIQKLNILTIGDKYRIEIDATLTAGDFYSTSFTNVIGFIASGSQVLYQIASAASFSIGAESNCVGTITKMSFKKIL